MWRITHRWRIVQTIEYEVDFHGVTKVFEKAQRAPWVRVIIQNKQKEIYLQYEYRYELDDYDRRLPWWKVFDTLNDYDVFLQSGDSIDDYIIEAAKRESYEEAWILLSDCTILWKKICGATMEWDLWYVSANVDTFDVSKSGEEWDHICEGKWFNVDEIYIMIKNWSIQEWRSVAMVVQFILDMK